MEWLFSIGLQNAAIMAFLAILVWGATRVFRSAPAAHLLWLLVLVKLMAPPFVPVDMGKWTAFSVPVAERGSAPPSIDVPRKSSALDDQRTHSEDAIPIPAESTPRSELAPLMLPLSSSSKIVPSDLPEPSPWRLQIPSWETLRLPLAWIWLIVAGLLGGVVALRVGRFRRILLRLPPASPSLQATADELGKRMGLRVSVDVLQGEGATAPFVWCFGSRPVVVMPRSLFDTLDERQLEMVLAHELAHLRRRDHWVRVAELAVSILFWWNPLVGWVRRHLHAAEEECCDAWVAWLFPDQNHLYAESLLQAAEAVRSPSVVMSSPFLNKHTLKARVEVVLNNSSQRKAPRLALVCLGLFALTALPVGVTVVGREVEQPSKADDEQLAATDSKDAYSAGEPSQAVSPEASEVNPMRSAVKQELASFQGTWSFDIQQLWDWPPPIGIGTDGKGRRSEKRWVVNGNQITWISQEGERIIVSFTIDPSKTPKEIDFKFLSGPYKGEKSFGIYQPDPGDDKFRWLCLTNPGTDAPRPTDISASSFKQQTMIGIHRVDSAEIPSLADPLQRFQGTFAMDLCDSANETLYAKREEVLNWRWEVTGNEILWSRQGQEWKVTCKIDPGKQPKEIDLSYLSGPFEGETCQGMYEWGGTDGKSLMIAIQDPGAKVARPTEFSMTGTSQTSMMILRPTPQTDAANELASLQGTWTLKNFDTASWPIPGGRGPDAAGEGSELQWTIRGNEITWTAPSGREIKASFTIDPSKSPKHMDLTFLTGPDRGEVCLGLYQRGDLDENMLWICIADPGSNGFRPTNFSYKRDESRSLLSLYPR